MKKIILPLLLCAALCGCGGAAAGNAVQDQYRTVRTARLEAEVTSHTDTDSRTFTLLCSYDAAGDAITTVTQPHELAGLTAVASGEDLTLACEGLQLPVGASSDICPANCLPYLLRALANGYVLEQGAETLEDAPWPAADAGYHRRLRRQGAVRRLAGRVRPVSPLCRVFSGRPDGSDCPAAEL